MRILVCISRQKNVLELGQYGYQKMSLLRRKCSLKELFPDNCFFGPEVAEISLILK
jgi:hypothetical protein